MTMTKGVSHKQEFFESVIFSRQNWPEREFQTYGHKTSAPHFFLDIKVFLMNYGQNRAKLKFLDGGFGLNWSYPIFKLFEGLDY